MKSTLLLPLIALGMAFPGAASLFGQAPEAAAQPQAAGEAAAVAPQQWALKRSRFPRQILRGIRVTPDSSVEQPGDAGVRSHTNHFIFLPDAATGSPQGETPQSIREVYGLPSTGGSGVIAIIDAYHYATALNDFNVFSREFGLPVETSTDPTKLTNKVFQIVYATGKQPTVNKGWNQEAALDIEWAHAMAPNAKIVLVEAASASNAALNAAVRVANNLPSVKQISMSYGSSETRNEAKGDVVFIAPNVVYIAASGDTGGVVNYPGCSAKVIAAGGTTINRDGNGDFVSETGWKGSGGGKSAYIPRPSYQNSISSIVGSSRGVPDLSFDADPASGVSIYDSTPAGGVSGWIVLGGTSAAAPALAGIINTAATSRGSFAASTAAELTTIYNQLGLAAYATEFRDVSKGKAGTNRATSRWDFVTGVGSPLGLDGK